MKITTLIFFSLLLAFQFGCNTPLEEQITDLHNSSRAEEKTVVPKLAELTQMKTSLAIQGRELSPQEVEFTTQASSIEQTYAFWQKGMSDLEKMPPAQNRLDLEKTMLEAIQRLRQQIESLLPKPPM